MSRDIQLKERWEKVVEILSNQFAEGEPLDLDAIIYLIGVQELGKFKRVFAKDEKVNLMHIAICKVLSFSGIYELEGTDQDGWPHWKLVQPLPFVNVVEQEKLLKEFAKARGERDGEVKIKGQREGLFSKFRDAFGR